MSKNIQVSLSPERVSLGPGETAEFVANIHNTSDVVEAYSIDVQGVDPAWSKLSVTSVSLFPGDKETVRIQVTPPVSSQAKAGSYPVSVRVISKRDPAIGTIASFILDLGKVSDYNLDLLPKKTKGRKGPFQLAITNNGNTVSTYKLAAFDTEDVCEFRFKSDTVAVDPGATKKTPVIVNPKKKPFTGAARSFSFSVKATPLEGEPKEVEGELECRALVPKWALAAIVVGVAALLVVLLVLARSGGVKDLSSLTSYPNLGAGGYRAYEFKVTGPGTITASAEWDGAADKLSLVLRGPNLQGEGGLEDRDRREGQGPLDMTYVVTARDIGAGNRWVLYVANISEVGKATVTVNINYASQ